MASSVGISILISTIIWYQHKNTFIKLMYIALSWEVVLPTFYIIFLKTQNNIHFTRHLHPASLILNTIVSTHSTQTWHKRSHRFLCKTALLYTHIVVYKVAQTGAGGGGGEIKKGKGAGGAVRSIKPGWVSYCLRSRAGLPSGAD